MDLQGKIEAICQRTGWSAHGETIELELSGERKQRVQRQPFDFAGKEMVRFHSIVGSAEALSQTRMEAALSINFGLAHGALAIHEGQLVLVDTFIVSEADEVEVESSIRNLAETADRFEKQIFGTDEN